MRLRNQPRQLAAVIGAGLLGLATVGIAPLLYGGGGDEGVDILPYMGPEASGGDPDGGGFGPPSITRPAIGYLTIHGPNLDLDANSVPYSAGFNAVGHRRADVFVGLPGEEPVQNSTALDILAKGKRKLFISEYAPISGGGSSFAFVHMTGRFEFEDLDPTDAETLEIVSRNRLSTFVGIVIGRRSTHQGGIYASFATIDQFLLLSVPTGAIDLVEARAVLNEAYGGDGQDVALVLYSPNPRGMDEVWVAWNADDARNLYDFESRTR